jgi:hypothetical protein
MDIDNVILFFLFMIGLLTTSIAGYYIVITHPNIISTFTIWFAAVFCLLNGCSWYLLGVKLTELEHKENTNA